MNPDDQAQNNFGGVGVPQEPTTPSIDPSVDLGAGPIGVAGVAPTAQTDNGTDVIFDPLDPTTFNNVNANKEIQAEMEEQPLVAAAPVPGSIGSSMSYEEPAGPAPSPVNNDGSIAPATVTTSIDSFNNELAEEAEVQAQLAANPLFSNESEQPVNSQPMVGEPGLNEPFAAPAAPVDPIAPAAPVDPIAPAPATPVTPVASAAPMAPAPTSDIDPSSISAAANAMNASAEADAAQLGQPAPVVPAAPAAPVTPQLANDEPKDPFAPDPVKMSDEPLLKPMAPAAPAQQSNNKVIIIAIAALVLAAIIGVVIALVVSSSNKKAPEASQQTSNTTPDEPAEEDETAVVCVRQLSPEYLAEIGGATGGEEKIMATFVEDEMSNLVYSTSADYVDQMAAENGYNILQSKYVEAMGRLGITEDPFMSGSTQNDNNVSISHTAAAELISNDNAPLLNLVRYNEDGSMTIVKSSDDTKALYELHGYTCSIQGNEKDSEAESEAEGDNSEAVDGGEAAAQ